MGCFSWRCSKTNIPVMGSPGAESDEESHVVVLGSDGLKIEGEYTGYGHIVASCLNLEITNELDNGTFKWVLKCFYDGETYESLPESEYDDGQGYFYEPNSIAIEHDKYRATGKRSNI